MLGRPRWRIIRVISNNPSYQLTIGVGPYTAAGDGYWDASQNVVIGLPITCDFEINRQFWGSSQVGTFTLHNLKEETRNLIYHDQYDTFHRMPIQFKAGYGNNLSLIFNGWVKWAYSKRPGRDFLTVLECFDGAFALSNAFSNFTLPAGSSFPAIVNRLNLDFVNTYKLTPNPLTGTFPPFQTLRPLVMYGPTSFLLRSILPFSMQSTIDLNQLKVLAYNDYVVSDIIPIIEADTGLLDPPERSGAFIMARALFNAQIVMGQQAILRSIDNSIFNGTYQIRGLIHRGIISPAVGGDRTTTLSLWKGTEALQPITP